MSAVVSMIARVLEVTAFCELWRSKESRSLACGGGPAEATIAGAGFSFAACTDAGDGDVVEATFADAADAAGAGAGTGFRLAPKPSALRTEFSTDTCAERFIPVPMSS